MATSSIMIASAQAQNAPEKTSLEFQRTSESALILEDELSRNHFRIETVQVPYQVTEEYIENVPYEDIEHYTEQVPYTVREAYTDTETYYENEHRCRTVTENERICRNNPVGRERCEYVRVPRTRTVTKYRDEARVGEPELIGRSKNLAVVLLDDTEVKADVKTTYDLRLQRYLPDGRPSTIGRSFVSRAKLKTDAEGRIILPGITVAKASELNSWATPGSRLIVTINIIRESSQFPSGPVELTRKAELIVQ